MIRSSKCNCCVHDKICAFKSEYENAIEALQKSTYPVHERGIKFIKDSPIIISVTCPHIMTSTTERNG